jgi:hypothetical protein
LTLSERCASGWRRAKALRERLAARKGEQLAYQRAGPLALALDLREVGLRGMVHRQIQAGQRRGALDAGEDVVEVVSDAAGEHAHGVHLLGALDLGLETLSLGDVAHAHHQPLIPARDLGHRQLEVNHGSVAAAGLAGPAALSDVALEARRQQLVRRTPDDLRRGDAEDALGGGVHAHQQTARAHGEQPIRDVLHDRPEVHLAPAKRGIRPAARCAVNRLGALSLHRGREPGQVVLHQIVVRAGLHRRDRMGLVHRAGDEDEGHVEPALLQTGQRLDRVELRHPVVRDDDVPGRGEERLLERIRGVHAMEAHQPPLGLQRVHDQGRICLGVLDQENAERAACGSGERSHEAEERDLNARA